MTYRCRAYFPLSRGGVKVISSPESWSRFAFGNQVLNRIFIRSFTGECRTWPLFCLVWTGPLSLFFSREMSQLNKRVISFLSLMQNRYTKTTPAKDISLFMKSAEERRVCFRMRQQGHSLQTIADAIGMNRRTITRWQTQGVQPPTRPKQRPALRKLSTALDAAILTYFTDNNTTTLRQAVSWLSSTHGISVCIHTVSRCCERLGLTWKKGSKVYTEMSYSRASCKK